MILSTYLNGQPFPAVVDGGPEHLVPDELHVTWVLALNEPAQVLLHDVAARLSADRNPHTNGSIFSFYLRQKTADTTLDYTCTMLSLFF